MFQAVFGKKANPAFKSFATNRKPSELCRSYPSNFRLLGYYQQAKNQVHRLSKSTKQRIPRITNIKCDIDLNKSKQNKRLIFSNLFGYNQISQAKLISFNLPD